MERARSLGERYVYVVRYEADDACFVSHPVELPEQIGAGSTADEALREARALTATTLATMIEAGQEPPPCSMGVSCAAP